MNMKSLSKVSILNSDFLKTTVPTVSSLVSRCRGQHRGCIVDIFISRLLCHPLYPLPIYNTASGHRGHVGTPVLWRVIRPTVWLDDVIGAVDEQTFFVWAQVLPSDMPSICPPRGDSSTRICNNSTDAARSFLLVRDRNVHVFTLGAECKENNIKRRLKVDVEFK